MIRIGDAVTYPTHQLAKLLASKRRADMRQLPEVAPLCEAARSLNYSAIAGLVADSLKRRSPAEFSDHVVRPCVIELFSNTCSMEIRVRERLFMAVLQQELSSRIAQPKPPMVELRVFVATLAPERHSIGALLAHFISCACGANSLGLGVELSIEDIAQLSQRSRPRVLALSFASEISSHQLSAATHALAKQLPSATRIVVGGRGLSHLGPVSLPPQCARVDSFAAYADHLLQLFEAQTCEPGRTDQCDRGIQSEDVAPARRLQL
ncbi:hypothetical protein [Pseudomarimonas arenosa]|uniref:B12-binding domain-containing protein n=1 Tax=Pseudomarimonas arenosa TaxID=2774145 RepID=A0AAW3ZLU2_9GAMM|nr:hypothetical protein [Pseudomarimonas arenosa]MBD8525637.1 hypothetical protein [Pseudomarimonas arenosa]